MKLRKMLVVFITMVLLSSLVVGCGSNQSSTDGQDGTNVASSEPEYVWKFGIEEYHGEIQDVYARHFKEVIEEKSDGKVKIEVYNCGQLGTPAQQAELLQNGTIQLGCVSPCNTGTLVPENQVFLLHFLFPENMDTVKTVLNESKALNEDLAKIYEKKSIKVLSFLPEGFMSWTSNKEITKPDDFKGLKWRTMLSPLIEESFKAYGANPTPMPYPEVYSGLQLNMIDGESNPISCINIMKFYEVQEYIIQSHHQLFVTTVSVNPDWFNSLPEDMQQLITSTVDELNDFAYDTQDEINGGALDEIKSAKPDIKIIEFTPEQRQAFIDASASVRDKYVEMVGDDAKVILDKLLEEIAEAEK